MGMNWMDPAVIMENGKVFGALSLVLTGVAIWDVLSTLWFEWQVISGKRKFKWPMIIYEVARISMLLHIFAMTINRNPLHKVACTQLIVLAKVGDALGTFMASLILMLRTRAVWHQARWITLLLGLLFVGQIAEWSQTFRYSTSQWNPATKVCDVVSTGPRGVMVPVWTYTMVFDLIILVLCSYQLTSYRSTTLGNVLFRDGICYFCFVFAANLVQTILAGLHLNPVMNLITVSSALVVSVIAATTVFRNVFIASDSFSGELRGFTGVASTANDGGAFRLHSGAHSEVVFNHDTRTREGLSTNETSLREYKSTHDIGDVSELDVVDVETDQGSAKGAQHHQNAEKLV